MSLVDPTMPHPQPDGPKNSPDTLDSAPESGPMPQNAPRCPTVENENAGCDQDFGLSQRQLTVLDLVLQGMTDTLVTKQVVIDRKTVYRWRMHDPAFRKVLEDRRRAQLDRAGDRLRDVTHQAIRLLEWQMNEGNDVTACRAARTVLKISHVGEYDYNQAMANTQTPAPGQGITPARPNPPAG